MTLVRMLATTLGAKIFARGQRCEKVHVGDYRELNFAVEAINIAILCARPHPNIVPYVVVRAFLITSPLYSSTLARHTVSTVDDIRRYVAQIGGALRHMHANGLLHRDVKPDNILCSVATGVDGASATATSVNGTTANTTVSGATAGVGSANATTGATATATITNYFLGDFGSTKVIVDHPLNTEDRTTRAYMAPELMRDGVYTVETDIWAFGATVFYLQHQREFDYRKFTSYDTAIRYLVSTCRFDDDDAASVRDANPLPPITGHYATNRYLCLSPARRRVGVWADAPTKSSSPIADRRTIERALRKATGDDADYFIALYFDEPIAKNNVDYGALSRLRIVPVA